MPENRPQAESPSALFSYANSLLSRIQGILQAVNSELVPLNQTFAKFNQSSDKYSKGLLRLTWALVVLTIVLIVIGVFTIIDNHNQTSIQNNIALNDNFFTENNLKIIHAIERGTPLLRSNGGKFFDAELDNYLGSFDVIMSSYARKLLKEEDFCGSFSYYLEVANSNTEIRNYIAEQQKVNTGFFSAFVEAADIASRSANLNCH